MKTSLKVLHGQKELASWGAGPKPRSQQGRGGEWCALVPVEVPPALETMGAASCGRHWAWSAGGHPDLCDRMAGVIISNPRSRLG